MILSSFAKRYKTTVRGFYQNYIMRILLFNTSNDAFTKQDYGYPLGLAYLNSVLMSKENEVKVIDYSKLPWKRSEGLVYKDILEFAPDVVGVSCLSNNRISSMQALKISKQINPNIITIAGGAHATALYKQILLNYPLDIVVLAEAEITIVELIKAIAANTPLAQIDGIAFKEDGRVNLTTPRKPIAFLDTIPFPRHESFSACIAQEKKAVMITTRGCPYKCKFCSSSSYWGKPYRVRSSKNVVDEMEMLIKQFRMIKEIIFWDDLFTIDSKRVIEICKEILERKININWVCQGHAAHLDEEMLTWMKMAGCYRVSVGIESGSARILENINKRINIPQIEQAFELLDKHGIRGTAFLMVGNPGESEETINETIELIKRIKIKDLSAVSLCQVFPQSPLYELAKGIGFITEDYWLSRKPAPYFTAEHSLRDLRRFYYKINIEFYKKEGLISLFKNVILKSFPVNPLLFFKKIVMYPLFFIRSILPSKLFRPNNDLYNNQEQ